MPYVRCAAGFILGLTLGSFLLPESVLAQLGRAAVTWSAESCPPGRYVVTSIATNLASGKTIEHRTRMVLPRDAFESDFGKAPHGHYMVRVEARRSDGLTFSSSQQMSIGGALLTAGFPAPGRQRPSTGGESAGFARPRPAAPGTGSSSLTTVAATSLATPHVAAPPAGSARARSADADAVAGTFAVMRKLDELAAAGHVWRQAQLIDVDEDGRWDAVSIELSDGAVLSWILPVR